MHMPTSFLSLLAVLPVFISAARAQIAPGELSAPSLTISDGNLNFIVHSSVSGRNYQLQYCDTLADGTWQDLGVVRSGDGSDLVISTPNIAGVARRFYRLALVEAPAAPEGFSLISAGGFQMGNSLSSSGEGYSDELPVHSVNVSEFYMAKYTVTKSVWDKVITWGASNGYTDLPSGDGKASDHPVHTVSWWAVVKWCNARSQMDNLTPCYYTDAAQTSVFKTGTSSIDNTMVRWSANGYRLPTEAEWEKAARGGMSGKRFPWGDVINHSYANYYNFNYSYESPQNHGYHPTYATGTSPYTSPVGSFEANSYGLYDIEGNVYEWCWDCYSNTYYTSSPSSDPRGAVSGPYRVVRGGSWDDYADYCRIAFRDGSLPDNGDDRLGFRPIRSCVP